jgi:hypothetical protein
VRKGECIDIYSKSSGTKHVEREGNHSIVVENEIEGPKICQFHPG